MRPESPRWQFDPAGLISHGDAIVYIYGRQVGAIGAIIIPAPADNHKIKIWEERPINPMASCGIRLRALSRGSRLLALARKRDPDTQACLVSHWIFSSEGGRSSAETVDVKGVTVRNNGRTLSLQYGFVIGDANRLKSWPQTGALAVQ